MSWAQPAAGSFCKGLWKWLGLPQLRAPVLECELSPYPDPLHPHVEHGFLGVETGVPSRWRPLPHHLRPPQISDGPFFGKPWGCVLPFHNVRLTNLKCREHFTLSSISAYWKLHNLQVCFGCLWHVRFWVSPGVQRWEVFLSISFPIYKVRMTVPTSSIVLRTKWGSICKTHLDKPTADGGCYCNEDIITALKVLLILKGKTHKLVIDSTCHC